MNELLRNYDKTKYESEYQYLLEEHGVHTANGAGYIAYRDGNEYITDGYYGQGYIYKDYDAWIYEGVVYVPEYGFPEDASKWVTLEGLPGTWTLVENVAAYTKEDFINLAEDIEGLKEISHYKGLSSSEIAEDIFQTVDWQFPESYIDIDLRDLWEEDMESLEESTTTDTILELDKLLSWNRGFVVGISACVGDDCSRTDELTKHLKQKGFDFIGPNDSLWYDTEEEVIKQELGFLVHIKDFKEVEALGHFGIDKERGFNQSEVYVWKTPITMKDMSTGTVKQLGYATALDGVNYRIDKEKHKTYPEEVKKEVKKESTDMESRVNEIVRNFEPEAIDIDIYGPGDCVVLVKDKNSRFQAWVDVWVEGDDVRTEWQKFVFYRGEELLSALMDDPYIYDYATSEAVQEAEAKGVIKHTSTAWAVGDWKEDFTESKSLKEATGNFTLSDYGFPTFAYMAYDWVMDGIYHSGELDGIETDAEREEKETELMDYYWGRWKTVVEEVEAKEAIEKANDDIYDLMVNTPLTKEAEAELGDDFVDYHGNTKEGWTLYDKMYHDEYPKVKVAPGYYEGASIIIDIPWIDLINAYDLNDKLAEIMYKHFGKEGLGMATVGVAYRFSSGETGYNLKVERRMPQHMTNRYELHPRYDARQSFYNKAHVEEVGANKYLYSYNTLVAKIEDGKALVYDTYSQTTLRHIKEFLLQNGFEATSKHQIMRAYGR